MKQGETLRNAIRGSGDTMDAAAAKLGITRRTLYTYMKLDKLPDDFSEKVKRKLGIQISQNVPRRTVTVDLNDRLDMLEAWMLHLQATINVYGPNIAGLSAVGNGSNVAKEMGEMRDLIKKEEERLSTERARNISKEA